MSESEQKRAEKLIALRDSLYSDQANFRTLWQDTADWILPMFGRIMDDFARGERVGETLYDITARDAARKMASGLSSEIIPPGQEFFDLKAQGREFVDDPESEEYLAELSEQLHEILFDTNFVPEFDAGILSLITFGIADTFPEFSADDGLTFRTFPIGSFQIRENSKGVIDTKVITVKRTARQLFQRYGNKIGKNVRDKLSSMSMDGADEPFEVIQIVQPRKVFRPELLFGKSNALNMPYESVHIGVQDRNILEEGGFPEFPFAMPRWHKSPGENYGRGQGTEVLPQVKKLNQMEADKTQAGNRWVKPPLEVLESFDGNVNLSPMAQNFVVERDTIKAIDLGAKGSYPIAREELDEQRNLVKQAFFHTAFAPLTDLKGDRRNTLEIRGRLREAYKQLTQPLTRLFREYCNPLISRSTRLLIANGVLPPPPPQLQRVKIVYTGPLALELRDQHVEAFQNWLMTVQAMEELQEGVIDNIDFDVAARDLARFMGVKESHIRSVAERNIIRQQREQLRQQQQKLEAAQAMAQGYGQMQKAPEPGSGAEALKEAV